MVHLAATRPALLTLCLAAAGVFGAPPSTRSTYAVKDSHHVPRQWSNVGPAPADHVINLNIALKQSQFDELERHLNEVSNPFHERYGQHLTAAEVNELVKPSEETLQLVHDWLQDWGVKAESLEYSPAKDWIKVALPVDAIERLLDTKYSVFEHEEGGAIVRAPVWSLPTHLHQHIETIQPTNSFFRAKAQRSSFLLSDKKTGKHNLGFWPAHHEKSGQSVAEVCNTTSVEPLCLRTLYGTIDYEAKAAGKNKVGLVNYGIESNNRSDVSIFLQQYRPEAAPAAYEFKVEVIAGGNDQQTPNTPEQNAVGKDGEGNLDAETILGIGYPTPLVAYSTGGEPPFTPDDNTPEDTNEPFLTWVQYVLAEEDIPQTISTSYVDDEQTVPLSYAQTVCNGFAQLGARGITLLFASGDYGVGPDGECFTNDGAHTPSFLPIFPASCPYVTAVGATKNFNPEVAAYNPDNDFASGGGFSNYFSRPAYQDAVVDAYIASLGAQYAYPGLYNKTGRGYPDLAAQGQRYAVIWNGDVHHGDGTSASSPCVAGVLTLVNDYLISNGRPPLGFLNPWLYAIGHEGFTDITSGSSKGCDTEGFPATAGWDPVTGFGTPQFKKLKELALWTKFWH